jgi:hypothetical protein
LTLEFIPAAGYLSSKALSGDFFFIRYCLLSSYLLLLSCFAIFGDRIGEGFFIESFKEGLVELFELVPE